MRLFIDNKYVKENHQNRMRQNETKQSLSQKQMKLLPVLLSSKTISEVSRIAGISRSTIYTWLQQENFKKAFEKQLGSLIDTAMQGLEQAARGGIFYLLKLRDHGSEFMRLQAADKIITLWMKMQNKRKQKIE